MNDCVKKQIKINDNFKGKLPNIIDNILASYSNYPDLANISPVQIPLLERVVKIINSLDEVIFPGFYGSQNLSEEMLSYHLGHKLFHLYQDLAFEIARTYRHRCATSGHKTCDDCQERGLNQALLFLNKIPRLRDLLNDDLIAAYEGDPAAKSYEEIIFSYPGFKAIAAHRTAHELYIQNVPLLPRMINEYIHHSTGIDIHPGAQIGRFFFIDHGTGVVIGETTEIGRNVKIYQGVTLGALSFSKNEKGELDRQSKRHPIVEDDVTIYSGATILGGTTVIGKGSVIGGNVWLTNSIPPSTKVVIEPPHLKYDFTDPLQKKQKVIVDFQI